LRVFKKAGRSILFAIFALGIISGLGPVALAGQNQGGTSPPDSSEEGARPISVGARVQLFATLCALDAAGFDSNGSTAGESAGRIQLREQMLQLQGPAVDAVRSYYREHALGDPGATLSRFISFALAVGPPPKFAFDKPREELPPDALALEGFNQILANFYQEAQIGQLWQRYQPDYQRGVEIFRAPVSEIVFTTTSYLREILKAGGPRTFSVYVEPLVGGRTNFRNYGNQYVLVVSPSVDVPVDDIRHAFLHFLLDPLAIRYRTEASRLSPLLNIAARAPLLPVEFDDDFQGFFAECLVRAVELRLRHLTPAGLAAAIDQAEGNGYVLVRPIYAGLAGFEKSAPSMTYYLPDLIKGIDPAAEQTRLANVKFAEAGSSRDTSPEAENRAAGASNASGSAGPVEQELIEGQRQIAARNGAAAAESFGRVLALRPGDMRATFGLAIASALMGKPDSAREYFSKVIAASQNSPAGTAGQPDPANVAWSHIYLGRMYDVEGKRDLAMAEYQAALAVKGAPGSAREAAQRGAQTAYQTPSRENKPDGKM
jgi:tetratricopeptide (TPR) repeat protein